MSIDWSYHFKELESGPIIKAYKELHVGPIVSAGRRDVDGRLLLVPGQNPDLDAGSAESHQRLFHALLRNKKVALIVFHILIILAIDSKWPNSTKNLTHEVVSEEISEQGPVL